MSNPYDPSTPSGEPSGGQPQNPYGTPTPGGYGGQGGTPYGAPYGGAGEMPKKNDGVSIAAFVLSLTCCLSIVGVILGFVGLKRTKDGQRKGRWAAIAAIPVGLVLTAASVILVVFVGIFAASVVSVDEAKTGICIDVEDSGSDGVIMTEKECAEPHDAEIIYAGEAGDDASRLEGQDATSVCIERVDAALSEVLSAGEYDLQALLEDPSDVGSGDKLVCYVTPSSGDKLDDKINP